MNDDKYLKTIIGYSTPLYEVNNDEDTENPVEDAEVEADFVDLVEHIGKEGFRNIYLNVIASAKQQPIERQITLCKNIIMKIEEVYDFIFSRKIYIGTLLDIKKVYKLIEFIEFDNLPFLVNLFDGLIDNLIKVNISEFVNSNWKVIQSRMNDARLSELVSEFIRTNNKENLISFITKNTERMKVEITGVILKRKLAE